ncbi:MAG TPA: DUF2199 domain-containing protein [Gemmatimonadales bacterium]|jgi:hypothetical protein|nr:DUF2199 domain-containing protein [Gemmatimonadales bacterium]
MVRCSQCGQEHDLFSIEPRYARPDAYLQVPSQLRDHRTRCGDDWCRLRGENAHQEQYFLRATLPVQVLGEGRQLHWGVWVEVDRPDYERVMELWDDPAQEQEPPIAARLANALPNYPSTLQLPGTIQLIGPSQAPQFRLATSLDHPLAREQRTGVYPERALEWVSRFLH